MSVELLVNLLARATLGVFLATAASFGVWWFSWVSSNTSDLDMGLFFLVQASIIGGSAAAVTSLAWWSTQSSPRVRWLSGIATVIVAVFGAWLCNEIRGIDTHYGLFAGVFRVPVFSLSHMLSSMMLGAVVAGNATAAVFYTFRAVRHREV